MKKTEFLSSSLLNSPQIPGLEFYSVSYANFSFPKHFHESFLVQYVEAGTDKFFCEGEYYSAGPHRLTLMNPGEVHTGSCTEKTPVTYKIFYPGENIWKQLFAVNDDNHPGHKIFFTEKCKLDLHAGYLLGKLYNRLAQSPGDLCVADSFYNLMTYLLTNYSETDSWTPKAYLRSDINIKRMIEFMRANIHNKVLLQDLAAIAYLSPFHLLRVFKKSVGLTPHEYLLNLRIEKAKDLLRKGISASETASLTGFTDPSHLGKSFKQMTGMTPGKFSS